MTIILSVLFISTLSIPVSAYVQQEAISLEDSPRSLNWDYLSPKKKKRLQNSLKDPLAKASLALDLKNYPRCIYWSRKVSSKSPVRDWAMVLELECAGSFFGENGKVTGKKSTVSKLVAGALARGARYRSPSPLTEESIEKRLLSTRLDFAQWLLKRARWGELKKQLWHLQKNQDEYSESDQGIIFELAGELLVAERKWLAAYWQFERSRLLNPSLSKIEGRLKAIMPMLSKKMRRRLEKHFIDSSKSKDTPAVVGREEQKAYNNVVARLKKNDNSTVAALVRLIREFPDGQHSKWASSKLLKMLLQEIRKSSSGDTNLKNKLMRSMLDLDVERQLQWAKTLFSRQAYKEAALLFRQSAEESGGTARSSLQYYLGARSYQLSGNLGEAEKLFKVLLKQFPASDHFVDGAIQMGLININQKEAGEAISHLEMARTGSMSQQQDLVSLFWLYHAYKLQKADKSIEKTRDQLLAQFPLTYYGLIAYSDKNEKKLPVYEKATSKRGVVHFSTAEKSHIERARALLATGLLDWAAHEINQIGKRKLSADEGFYLANFYISGATFNRAFPLLFDSLDIEPSRRNKFVIEQIFPKPFYSIAKNKKNNSGVDPWLLMAVMKQESAFNPRIVSPSNAIGLLQMLPSTARQMKRELKLKKAVIPEDLYKPETNVILCAYYLKKLIKRFDGSVPRALAGYNAGPTRFSTFIRRRGGTLSETWVDELPWSETSFYVKAILKNYLVYRAHYGGLKTIPSPPWGS